MIPSATLELWWTSSAERLFRFALHLARGDWATAEDLRSEAFLRAATSSYNGKCAPYTFLHRIVTCVNADRMRKIRGRRGQRQTPGALAFAAEVAARDDGPVEAAERAEVAERVRAAAAALPHYQRRAVVLVAFEERTYDEAAEIAGVAHGTIGSSFFEARAALRRTLAWAEAA